MSGQELRLKMGQEAYLALLSDVWMGQLFLFALLPSHEQFLARIITHRHGPTGRINEVLSLNLSSVDERKNQSISHNRAEFLHQIEGKARATGTVGVKKPHAGIKPHAFQCRPAVMDEEGIDEGEKCVNRVKRGASISPREQECFVRGRDHLRKRFEVGCCRLPFNAAEFLYRVFSLEAL